jgi:hypothetical protein
VLTASNFGVLRLLMTIVARRFSLTIVMAGWGGSRRSESPSHSIRALVGNCSEQNREGIYRFAR